MERVEPLDHDHDFARPIDPRRRRSTRRNVVWLLVILVALIVAGMLVWRRTHAPEVVSAPPQAAAPQPATPAPDTTAPKYPIEAASTAPPAPAETLPAVADSDAALQDAMAAVFNGVPLDRIFHMQAIVPRFVATIDNLPRQTVALSKMPVKPIGGSVETTTTTDGHTLLRADNAERYTPYLRLMEQASTQKLVQTYVHFYPLFQKAYQDLGYPKGYFNDRLIEVIDHLLAAPDVPAPIALTQPKVLFEFADPSLEQLSAGQKMMIRIGPVNESRVKAKLADIRHALTGQTLPR
ncbi:MAG TPA: DUF3014 domain-containing protein [Casimicrobiaceae bacterium]|nr:DUF3014 domain-containing protein [Casimicrobiaceae bacterium]